jgi:hypothetical protein
LHINIQHVIGTATGAQVNARHDLCSCPYPSICTAEAPEQAPPSPVAKQAQ